MSIERVTVLRRRAPTRAPQRGLSLLFALLALAAMMLAAVALVRSVDSGAIVLGNLGFKQDATAAADRAAEEARTLLRSGTLDLTRDHEDRGYYATSQDLLDPTGQVTSTTNKLALVDWDRNNCAGVVAGTYESCTRKPSDPEPYNGVSTRYIITRLCPSTGSASAANVCAQPSSNAVTNASARGQVSVGTGRPDTVTFTPYYRIIVRSVGARNTVSFTEMIIH